MLARSRQPYNRTLTVLGAVLIIATGSVFVAHGSRSSEAAARPVGAANTVQIENFLFAPEALTVPAGTKITFTNEDGAPHTATSGTSPSADGVFDTGTLAKGAHKSVTVSKAGTYTYYCAIHPFMKGTVTVR
jgi:plastocyanin